MQGIFAKSEDWFVEQLHSRGVTEKDLNRCLQNPKLLTLLAEVIKGGFGERQPQRLLFIEHSARTLMGELKYKTLRSLRFELGERGVAPIMFSKLRKARVAAIGLVAEVIRSGTIESDRCRVMRHQLKDRFFGPREWAQNFGLCLGECEIPELPKSIDSDEFLFLGLPASEGLTEDSLTVEYWVRSLSEEKALKPHGKSYFLGFVDSVCVLPAGACEFRWYVMRDLPLALSGEPAKLVPEGYRIAQPIEELTRLILRFVVRGEGWDGRRLCGELKDPRQITHEVYSNAPAPINVDLFDIHEPLGSDDRLCVVRSAE